jgi:hypothetical protein
MTGLGLAAERRSYTFREAAAVTGYSLDTIRRAVNCGDLTAVYPHVNGKPTPKGVIRAAELERWLDDAPTQAERTP